MGKCALHQEEDIIFFTLDAEHAQALLRRKIPSSVSQGWSHTNILEKLPRTNTVGASGASHSEPQKSHGEMFPNIQLLKNFRYLWH